MLHCWCKILLKSDIICLSYKNVHRGLLFSRHSVYICVLYGHFMSICCCFVTRYCPVLLCYLVSRPPASIKLLLLLLLLLAPVKWLAGKIISRMTCNVSSRMLNLPIYVCIYLHITYNMLTEKLSFYKFTYKKLFLCIIWRLWHRWLWSWSRVMCCLCLIIGGTTSRALTHPSQSTRGLSW